jgi:hypothetical protein
MNVELCGGPCDGYRMVTGDDVVAHRESVFSGPFVGPVRLVVRHTYKRTTRNTHEGAVIFEFTGTEEARR